MKALIKFIFVFTLLSILACTADEQTEPKHRSETDVFLTPEDFINPDGAQMPTVTLVGAFHFDYPGLDVHKTEETDKIDVLRPERQKEMEQLLDHLAKFKPNKIAIESTQPDRWNAMYRDYLNGTLEPMRDERVQLGFALGKRFDLDTMYCLDAGAFSSDYDDLCPVIDTIFKDYDWQSDDPMESRLMDYIKYRDKMLKTQSLYDLISEMNTEAMWNFNYGGYLIGDFKLDNLAGADALALYWYNRNLRIFRKIQMITESPDDRILVIFGNGHVAILNQLFKCTPEYTYTPFQDL